MMTSVQNCQTQAATVDNPAPVRLASGCKINLYLTITGIRQHGPHAGWHELDTVFVPLSEPCDTLVIRKRGADATSAGAAGLPELAGQAENAAGLVLHCATPGIDLLNNTLTRAYRAFAAAAQAAQSVQSTAEPGRGWTLPLLEVELIKGVPHGAGLGGGSADAATLLRWLDGEARRAGVAVSAEALAAAALSVGADVPFFLKNEPCRATGLGDVLEPANVDVLTGWHLVLVMPQEQVPTPWAFRAFDEARLTMGTVFLPVPGKKMPHFPQEGLTGGGEFAISSFARREPVRLENDFEKVVFATYPGLAKHKAFLLQAGAAAAVMSGSGSSIFGLFREAAQAASAVCRLRTSGVKCALHSFTSAR